MAAVGEGLRLGAKMPVSSRPGSMPLRQRAGWNARLGDLLQRDRAVGAGDGEAPVGELDVGFRGLQHMRGDLAALVDHLLAPRASTPSRRSPPSASRRCRSRRRPCRCRPAMSGTSLGVDARACRRRSAVTSSRGPGPGSWCPSTSVTVPLRSKRISRDLRAAAGRRRARWRWRCRCRAACRASPLGAPRLEAGAVGALAAPRPCSLSNSPQS